MNKSTKILLLSMCFVFALLALGSATVITPAQGASISQVVNLNATNSSLPIMLNCSFYAWSSLSANTSQGVVIAVATNTTANALAVNVTFNTTGLQDASDYTFLASCRNSTNAVVNSSNTGITIDNTNPTAPSALSPATFTTKTTSGVQTFTATVDDPSTTSCSLTIGRGGVAPGSSDTETITGTYSTNTCTAAKTFSSSTANGNWFWYFTASDGADDTQSAQNELNVNIPGSGGGGGALLQQQGAQVSGGQATISVAGLKANKNMIIILGITALVVILAISAFFIAKKK